MTLNNVLGGGYLCYFNRELVLCPYLQEVYQQYTTIDKGAGASTCFIVMVSVTRLPKEPRRIDILSESLSRTGVLVAYARFGCTFHSSEVLMCRNRLRGYHFPPNSRFRKKRSRYTAVVRVFLSRIRARIIYNGVWG